MTSTVVHGSSSAANHGVAGASFLALFLVLFLFLETPTALAQSGDSPATDPYMDAKLTPSMAIIIVVLIAAMFFMGFFSIYIRHCSENRGGSGSVRAVVGAVTGLSRRGARGLDPSVLQTFPTFGYEEVKGLKLGKGALECAVCLNEFEDNETLRLIPKCDHVFHPDCIDAWLSSHTTCPVCRANLASESVHAVDAAQQPDDGEDLPSETSDPQNEIAIRVTEPADLNGDANPNPQSRPTELPNLGQPVHQNRPPRSKSMKPRFFSRFPRSHSTGHSLIQPGENCERFTLRLPADVRKQLMNRSLKRTSSLVVFPRAGSSRRGFRTGGEGSSRGRSYRRFDRLDRGMKSDRWIFSMAPPFFSRASSLKSPKVAADGEGSSTPPKPLMGSVKGPLNCLSTKADDGELLRPAV